MTNLQLPPTEQPQDPQTPAKPPISTTQPVPDHPLRFEPKPPFSMLAPASYEPPPPAPKEPPPDFEEKMARLLKVRADALTKGVVDDHGVVLREPMDPEEAMQAAIDYLPKYLQSEDGPEEVRGFMYGRRVPNGWTPVTGVVKSYKTQELEWQAKYGREQNPVYAAVRDYVIDPLGNFGASVLQVPTNIAVSGLRHLGIAPPDAELDVLAKAHELAGTTRDELAAIESTKSLGARIVGGGGSFVGTAGGFTVGIPGKVLGAAGTAGGNVGKALFGPAGKAVGHGAGVFGAYEGLVAKPGEVIEQTAKGAAAGAAMGIAQQVASLGLRHLFRTPIANLGADEKSAMDALKKWAVENRVLAEKGESVPAFEKRIVDTWIAAGLPGAPAMPARKLMAAAVKGGADAVGFSLLDQQFREDLLDAAWNGDTGKWQSVVETFSGNFLGAAALHMPLSSIVPWQRRQRFGKAGPTEGEGKAIDTVPAEAPKTDATDVAFSVQTTEPLALPAPKETRVEKLTREQDARLAQDYTDRWERLFDGGTPQDQARWENIIGGSLDNVIPLGWRPSEKSVRERSPEAMATDIRVQVGGNTVRQLLASKLIPENSALGKQLRELPGGGEVTIPRREADRFVDYYTRRAERKRDELGHSSVQSIDSFVEKLTQQRRVTPVARDFNLARGKAEKVAGPEGAPAQEPIGEPVTGKAAAVPEKREGVSERKVKIELAQSGHSFTLEGETGRPSPALKEALGLPASLPAKDLAMAVDKASLVSALHAKSQLPGEEVSIGVKAVAGKGDAPGAMWRVVMGEIQTSPLRPDPVWQTVDRAPARGKDALDTDQIFAVDLLRSVANSRNDIAPPDRSLLNASIEVLDTVSAANDPAVAETLKALPKLFVALKVGDPGAERALAESLTTKTPAQALADMAAAQEAAKARAAQEREAAQTLKAKMTGVRPVESKAEPTNPEAGFVDTAMVAEAAARAADALALGARAGGNVIGRVWDRFQRSQIQRVEDLGMRDVAEMGREATTATKRFQARLDTAGLMGLRRTKRSDLDSMQDLVRDENGGYADRYARAMDAATAKHFGEATLSPKEQDIVHMGRAVTLEAGKIAEELGVQQTDSNGKYPRAFTTDPNRRVLVREYTPEMQQARLQRKGPLFDAMVKWLSDTYGVSPKEAEAQFTDARSLVSLDATEIRRTFDVIPTHIDVPGRGVVRVLESRPLEHAERLAFRNSQVMGARSVLPRLSEKPAEGAREFPQDPTLEPLPPTAQQLVNRVLNERGPEAADAVASMVRAMHGMQLKPDARIFTPGEPGYHFFKVLDHLLGVRKAGALTMSFAMNAAEPLSNIAHFGGPAVLGGYKEAAKSLVTGDFARLHRQAVADGFVADTKLNDPWKGDNAVETVENSLKKIGEILTTPMRMSQDFNEMVNYVAARDRLSAMRAGEGNQADANALSLLGFQRAEVDQMLAGNGTEAQYERYKRNIVGALAGGRSLRSAEKSDLAHSRGFNTMVWFTNFFQARSRALNQLVKDIREAPPGARADQFGQLVRFAGMTLVGGAIGTLFRKFLSGGSDGMADYIREQTAGDTVDTAKNLLGLMASGVVGGLGQPVVDAFGALGEPGDSKSKVAAAGLRLLGPVDTGIQFVDFLRASMFDVDVPGYENKDLLGKTAKYLRDVMPAAKTIHEGAFGIGALAISEKNKDLDEAQDSYYRWARENRPQDFVARARTEEQRAFRDSMRAVMDKVAADKQWTDDELVDAVVDAEAARLAAIEASKTQKSEQGERVRKSPTENYKEARAAVVASLRARKMLPEPGEMSTEQVKALERHLGEKHLQTLRDYDEVIDVLAKRVRSANLRREIETRR